MNASDLIDQLLPVVLEAGERILEVKQRGVTVLNKSDGSPVTEADAAAEKLILHALQHVAEGTPVVSEENSDSHALKEMERFFLVDPLDGTKEFLKPDGKGAFTVNIALVEAGEPVSGIVYAPALDRLFYAVKDVGAFERSDGQTKQINVRAVPRDGPVAVASISHRDMQTENWLKSQGIMQTVSIGSSLKFCLVACGEADVYPRFGPTMEWDTAAGDAILRMAGGTVTGPDGKDFHYGKSGYKNGPFIAFGSYHP